MTHRRKTRFAAALLTAFAVSGCAASPGGSLDAQSATPSPTCLVHQKKEPAERYTAGSEADPRSVLEMLHYYTANGTKAFCDGKPPTRTDRQWMTLYTSLGGRRSHVPGAATRTP
ncbi:hypothetical protein [Streptomyces sp. NBC_01014]|uniref:hypothetical protein n=1 Tax=Streptomyces sp. NBC_01014 TaxID=2903719 RepID=UPI003869FA1B|nr:hypothetical protein OG282_14290 [Streptomyces sp. NBC_01014]